MPGNLLIDRVRYDQMVLHGMSVPKTRARLNRGGVLFNPSFMMMMDHVGILESSGIITMLKDRTAGYSFVTKEQWNERTKV